MRNAAEWHHHARLPLTRAAGVSAFRRGDQLQQLLWIVQPLLKLGAERLSCNLSGDTDVSGEWIGSHEFHFVYLDGARFPAAAQCFFNLFGNILCFGAGKSKGANQACEVFNGDAFRKMQAGKAGCGQQLPETFFYLPGFERNAIEQQFALRNS